MPRTDFCCGLTLLVSLHQAAIVTKETDAMPKAGGRQGKMPSLPSHSEMEAFIGWYSGLVLYTREMDENAYSKICAVRLDLVPFADDLD